MRVFQPIGLLERDAVDHECEGPDHDEGRQLGVRHGAELGGVLLEMLQQHALELGLALGIERVRLASQRSVERNVLCMDLDHAVEHLRHGRAKAVSRDAIDTIAHCFPS